MIRGLYFILILTILKTNMTLQLPKMRVWSWQVAQLGIILVILGLSVFFLSNQQNASANQSGWLKGEPFLVSKETLSQAEEKIYMARSFCEYQGAYFVENLNKPADIRAMDLCVTEGDGFRFAEGYHPDSNRRVFAISIGSDAYFYKVDLGSVSPFYSLVVIPGTTKFVISAYGINFSSRVYLYDNLLNAIKREGSVYKKKGQTNLLWGRSTYGWGISRNGRYMVYAANPGTSQYSARDNTIIEDLETGEGGVFGKAVAMHLSLPNWPANFVVSDDGKEVASTSAGVLKFWNVEQSCLKEPGYYLAYAPDPCPSFRFAPSWHVYNTQYPDSDGIRANEDFSEISYTFNPKSHNKERITISKYGSVDTSQLDYLAMGDSYSSGEGDVDYSSSHYMPGTEGKDECHLSNRSYPFLLRRYWGVHPLKMKSVACSGARVLHDYIMPMKYYIGQHEELEDVPLELRPSKIESALNKFAPGIVPQLEFVKKYKPKVLTLTAGGNDVGFGDILSYCAALELGNFTPIIDSTCRYAKDDDAKQELINSIHNQYGVTKLMINKIKQASPDTKIYIIGYPQFVAVPTHNCLYNSASLNIRESGMIREMVTEMNNVLWRAANDAGAVFIDIEDSLEGGQICQSSLYMTGVIDMVVSKRVVGFDTAETFHPNHRGHARIARIINHRVRPFSWNQYPGDARQAEDGSVYASASNVRMLRTMAEPHIRGASIAIKHLKNMFKPYSKVKFYIFSEETKLGELTADSSGSISANINLPDSIRPGYHNLVVKGKTYSGEPITLYQFVTIYSDKEGDMDGDGIPDDKDRCMFITSWIDETTGKDVCVEPEKIKDTNTNNSSGANEPTAVVNRSVSFANPAADSNTESIESISNKTTNKSDSSKLDTAPKNGEDQHSAQNVRYYMPYIFLLAILAIILIGAGILVSKRRSSKK
ncbi:hypothetical protein CR969_00295 [Candidatus Saccharibacteria bacterium]|nr:MAG: hypothetical protein CR969_00295 [Candidatus Saccharibacteria bacterium]